MRKLLICAVLLAAVGAQAGAGAETTTGHILVGNPTTAQGVGAASELAAACAPGDPADGIDAQWFTATEGSSLAVTLAGGATGIEDLDVYFYTASCDYIDDLSMVSASPSETGTVADGAAYIAVDLAFGADASFDVITS